MRRAALCAAVVLSVPLSAADRRKRAGGGMVTGQAVLFHLNDWAMEDMAVRAPVAVRMEFPHVETALSSFSEPPGQTTYTEAKKKYEEQLHEVDDFTPLLIRAQKAKTIHEAVAFAGENPRNLPYEAAVPFGLPRAEALKAITLHAPT